EVEGDAAEGEEQQECGAAAEGDGPHGPRRRAGRRRGRDDRRSRHVRAGLRVRVGGLPLCREARGLLRRERGCALTFFRGGTLLGLAPLSFILLVPSLLRLAPLSLFGL